MKKIIFALTIVAILTVITFILAGKNNNHIQITKEYDFPKLQFSVEGVDERLSSLFIPDREGSYKNHPFKDEYIIFTEEDFGVEPFVNEQGQLQMWIPRASFMGREWKEKYMDWKRIQPTKKQ